MRHQRGSKSVLVHIGHFLVSLWRPATRWCSARLVLVVLLLCSKVSKDVSVVCVELSEVKQYKVESGLVRTWYYLFICVFLFIYMCNIIHLYVYYYLYVCIFIYIYVYYCLL